jgi:hypothetical protein
LVFIIERASFEDQEAGGLGLIDADRRDAPSRGKWKGLKLVELTLISRLDPVQNLQQLESAKRAE